MRRLFAVLVLIAPAFAQEADSEEYDRLEALYRYHVERAKPGLELGLAQAELGFHYQRSDVSADQFHGERYVELAIRSFEQCSQSTKNADQCRRLLADTAGIQGSIYFQKLDYKRAEPLFRRVTGMPDDMVQAEVLFVSLHALRGILILRKENAEAQTLLRRAEFVEKKNHAAIARLRDAKNGEGTRSRAR